jgi:hypothetical protein
MPYFPILITAALNKHLERNLISLSSGPGVVAKILIFYFSYYGNNILNVRTKRVSFYFRGL